MSLYCTKLYAVNAILHHNLMTDTYSLELTKVSVLTRAASQHTDTSKNTKTTVKCCYVLHSYVGTIFSHVKVLS